MKVVEKILAEDTGESLQKHVAELEAEEAELIAKLQRSLDNGVEDYNLLMVGNESLLAECNDLLPHAEDLESELGKVRATATADVAELDTKILSAKAHSVDVAAASEKRLKGFQG
jgi:hypothetical protein